MAVAPERPEAKEYQLLPTVDVGFVAVAEQEPQPTWLEQLHDSLYFSLFMNLVIVGNAVVMGFETDLPTWPCWEPIEYTMLVVFVIEIVLKGHVQGLQVFYKIEGNADIWWNLFDLIVVSLGVLDIAASVLFRVSSGGMATMFRIIRLLRIMRLFRIFKFLKKLLLLAVGFFEAAQAVAWVTLLMSVVFYMCSIVMVRTCGNLPESDPHAVFLHHQFRDIRTSMLTLFVLMSSPNLPLYIAQDGLLFDRPLLLAFLVMFIIVGSFGLIAVLTGVISESMFEKNQMRLEESRKEQDDMISMIADKADEIHMSLDLNEDGEAKRATILDEAMPLVAKLFESALIEFTQHNLVGLVDLMDTDGSQLISADEFKNAIVSYATGLRPLSIQEVHFNVCCCLNKLEKLEESVARLCDAPLSPMGSARSARPVPSAGGLLSPPSKPRISPDVSRALSPEQPDTIFKGLQELKKYMRESTNMSLSNQNAIEASLHRGLAELREHVQEHMAATLEQARELVLPGGFIVGERVVSKIDYTIELGYISRDDVGIVKGFSTGHDRERVNVDFPHLRSVNMMPSQIRRDFGAAPSGQQGVDETKSTTVETCGTPGSSYGKSNVPPVRGEQRLQGLPKGRTSTPDRRHARPCHVNGNTHTPLWSGPGSRAIISMSRQSTPRSSLL